MPPQIGHFISDAVYNGKLQSNPKHPITDEIQACFFINAGGNEKFENTSYWVKSFLNFLHVSNLTLISIESYRN